MSRSVQKRTFLALASCLAGLAAAAGAAGCGLIRVGNLDPPPGKQFIRDIDIEGAEGVDESLLIEGLATEEEGLDFAGPKPVLDRTALPVDARRLEAEYARHGYFDARVTGWTVHPRRADFVEVTFHVVEGRPTRISRILVAGLAAPPGHTLPPPTAAALAEIASDQADLVRHAEGDIWTEADHLATRDALRNALVNAGFRYATVASEVQVDRGTLSAFIVHSVEPGPLVRVDRVVIRGAREIDEARIRRRVTLRPGDVVTTDALLEQEERVRGLDVFYGVRARPVLPDPDDGDRRPAAVPVEIIVDERPLHELRLGGGLRIDNQRTDIHLEAGYAHHRLFGDVRHFDATLRPGWAFLPTLWAPDTSSPIGELQLRWRELSVFGVEMLDFFLSPRYRLVAEDGYRYHEASADARLAQTFGPLTVGLSWSPEYVRVFDVSEVLAGLEVAPLRAVGLAWRESYFLSVAAVDLTLDLRDRRLDPHRGTFFYTSAGLSRPELGSDFSFVRLVGEARAYVTAWNELTLALRLWGGHTLAGGGELPISARFIRGGSTSMRGYEAGRMGPYVCETELPDGAPASACPEDDRIFVGGRSGIEGNVELRWRPGGEGLWGFVAFVDTGRLWTGAEGSLPPSLDWAVGPGLRLYTPVGPLRIDLGILLVGREAPDFAFHFSLGQAY